MVAAASLSFGRERTIPDQEKESSKQATEKDRLFILCHNDAGC